MTKGMSIDIPFVRKQTFQQKCFFRFFFYLFNVFLPIIISVFTRFFVSLHKIRIKHKKWKNNRIIPPVISRF